ncbi:MAG TPA: DUF2784 domain-containing protein [Syntrophus sp. (in: bacteria)]|nr:MAG: hypothetical protein A2X92_04255 [Syntrophus sp. GWC2_56_31]HBB18612.1 DUF2784 domain-containing protein [Syntrophus sp. (in: bacteria)]
MAATLLADLVVILHGVFVLIAVLGGFLVFRWRWWAWFHIPAFLWAGFIEATGGICPLTPLENRLRTLGGEAAYGGDFIDRYLTPLLYPDDLTREIQIVLGIFVILFNIGIYAVCWCRKK